MRPDDSVDLLYDELRKKLGGIPCTLHRLRPGLSEGRGNTDVLLESKKSLKECKLAHGILLYWTPIKKGSNEKESKDRGETSENQHHLYRYHFGDMQLDLEHRAPDCER
eukprot:CAMPEP_0167768654 /NCGR_PEP_ID=MMETSP0110_2-20121227/16804_1 /TAXON_ID=629695 /ORGANISM="Gymnochlora sp., Strain CCMP2014" /LENGTH=108 /DNA_ID=CAMNT_0007657385 /DNA_START=77 /DNA_END=403 /DNA_ORIENTATION=+